MQQSDPMGPGYPLNHRLVSWVTPIERGSPLDAPVFRPRGMQGWCVMLTVEGGGTVRDLGTTFDCVRGDLMLYAKGVGYDYARSLHQERWLHRWAYFHPRTHWLPWLSWPGQAGGVGRIRLSSEALIEDVDRRFQAIAATRNAGKRTSEDMACALLEELLIRCHEENPRGQPQLLDKRIQAACLFITQHINEPLPTDRIAAHACLSPSRLAHLFVEQKHMSIGRWIQSERLQLAKQLLRGTTLPVISVAATAGYADPLYFSRVFSRQLGVSPSDYRASCGNTKLPWL